VFLLLTIIRNYGIIVVERVETVMFHVIGIIATVLVVLAGLGLGALYLYAKAMGMPDK
jgi:hypothetical protein